MDMGMLYKLPNNLSFGVNSQNIVKFTDSWMSNLYPATYVGVSHRLDIPLRLSVGAKLSDRENATYLFGFESDLIKNVSLRMGYSAKLDSLSGGNAGAGFGVNWMNMKMDYAYVPNNELGSTHRISLVL